MKDRKTFVIGVISIVFVSISIVLALVLFKTSEQDLLENRHG